MKRTDLSRASYLHNEHGLLQRALSLLDDENVSVSASLSIGTDDGALTLPAVPIAGDAVNAVKAAVAARIKAVDDELQSLGA
jgi:hypothetical protein